MKKRRFNDNWVYHSGGGSAIESLLGIEQQKMVTLPHDAAVEMPRDPSTLGGSGNGFFQEKNCYYTKNFTPDGEDTGKEFYLEFEGVYQNAFVYINGAFAGKHPYGYSPFALNITRFLVFGQPNTIKVVVKNSIASGRWYTGTGIYRNVNLLVGNRLRLVPEGIHLSTISAEEDLATVRCDATITYSGIGTRDATLTVQLLDADGTVVAENTAPVTMFEGMRKTVRQNLYVRNPRLWDVEKPNLYRYRAVIQESGAVLDEEIGTFGIRTLQLDVVHGLRINGKTVKLRGGCIHHDNGILGTAEFPHCALTRVRKLKEAGYNAIRSAHHPMSSSLLDACDRLGMLVMDEFSDVWTATKVDFDYGTHMTEWWQQDVAAMVNKDYNHPCVILYSIGNEICEAGNKHDVQWGQKITELIREIDPTRYTTNCLNMVMCVLDKIAAQYLGSADGAAEINTAMEQLGPLMEKIVRSDAVAQATQEAFGQVDIAGYNYAAVRYEPDGVQYPNRVIVGSETYPPDLDKNWELVERLPHVIGDFSWTAWDYLGEAGIGKMLYDEPARLGVYAAYPYKAAYCGDFNLIGDRRPISYWREIIWGLRRAPYLAVRPPQYHGVVRRKTEWCFTDAVRCWNWEGCEGKPITVEAYTNAQEAALYCNGRLLEKKPVGTEKKAIVLFETVYEPGALEIVAYENGIETGRDRILSAKQQVELVVSSDAQTIPADGSDICYVDVALMDDKGNLHFGACKAISIEVAGPGLVQGFGSANPNSEENYFDRTANTYEGRLRAAIRATGKGTITVTFRADGCQTKTVHITAEETAIGGWREFRA